jgi:spermidine synthase
MIYEFLVVHILARYFGSATTTWAAVIAVLLAGLSVGYAVGGHLAERYGTIRPLALALLVGGLTGAVMEPIAIAVGESLLQVDTALTLHPYLASMVVSFVPIFCLGMVLPQAIRLSAAHTGKVGKSAGRMSAISTIGSIVGVVVTVHVCFPYVGVRETLYAMSGLLIFMALVLLAPVRGRTVAMLGLLVLTAGDGSAKVIYAEYSSHHHILVEDRGGQRLLRFNNDVQSTMSLAKPDAGGFEYTEFFHVPLLLNPGATSTLFLGLGGATGPKVFLKDYPKMQIEVVELDPQVLQVAKSYFSLPDDPRLKVNIADGRVHLQRSNNTFDIIIMDAYASSRYGAVIPYHMATREFFHLIRDRLKPGGCLVYNVVGFYQGNFDAIVRGIYATLQESFPTIYIFEAKTSENTVFVVQKSAPEKDLKARVQWPEGPWRDHPLTPEKMGKLAETLGLSGLIKVPEFEERVRQYSRLNGLSPGMPVYTDNNPPSDIKAMGPGK